MAIVGYARVSSVGQDIDLQIEQLKTAGVDPRRIFQETISGAKRERPELNRLVEFVRDGDTVVATRLDRLARSTQHLLELVERFESEHITLKILNINLDTGTPTGRLMLTMLGAIATFERELMLERQAEGIAKAKEAGRYKGRKPTALAKSTEALRLLGEGFTKQQVADRLKIGVASVYRIVRKHQASTRGASW